MPRSMPHYELLLLRFFILAAVLVASTRSVSSLVVLAADTKIHKQEKLSNNNLHEFVGTKHHQLNAVVESNLENYDSWYVTDLHTKTNQTATTPDDRLDIVDDNLVDDETGNQLTVTNVANRNSDNVAVINDNHQQTYISDSFVNSYREEEKEDFPIVVGRRILDENHGSKMKTSITPQVISRKQVKRQNVYTEEWIMMGKSQIHRRHTMNNKTLSISSTYHHDVALKESSSNQQRDLQSCVSSVSELARAVKKASTTTDGKTTTIKICTSRIPMGSLNRRRNRRRHLQSTSTFNSTNVTLTGLSGGINLSNRSIIFTCLLKQRCILDGEGISRIFYGTNAIITIDGFQFLNASSLIGDALGSGSALTLIGSSKITLRDCRFIYNTAPNAGGAIMINNSTLILQSSRRKIQFLQNYATYGGAIFSLDAAIKSNITSSFISTGIIDFQDNYASQDGGGVYAMDSTVVLNQVTMERNGAADGGAAMFVDTDVTMTNMHVEGNMAKLRGGAFVFLHADAVIINSTVESNNGNGTVEAITIDSSNVEVINSSFRRSRWYVTSSTLNLTNTCLPQGSNCMVGASCNDCCKPYSYWLSKAGNYCGPQPKKKCFGSDSDLYDAVRGYYSGNITVITNLTNIYGNVPDWCTGAVSNFSFLFANVESFNDDISKWDTSNATVMNGMFFNAVSFNQDISKWNTSKVNFMITMFGNASSFNQDISKWDTSNVIRMSYMFYYATSFNQNISTWNTSNVDNMEGMFYKASSFNEDISKWDTSKVANMSYMFYYATSFNRSISAWNTSNVYRMYGMFLIASTFNQDISKWDTSKAQVMDYMFSYASSFNQDISNWDVSNVTTMRGMFRSATNFNGNITKWNVSQVNNMDSMFQSAIRFNRDISGWDISKVTTMAYMFYGASAFNQSLCLWENKCQPSFNSTNAFQGAISCPNQSDPVCMSGPFCYSC